MFGLTLITWLRFVIWLALGLIIYIFIVGIIASSGKAGQKSEVRMQR